MTVIEKQWHVRSDEEHRIRPVKRWLVLKECEAPFKAELEQMGALRELTTALELRNIHLRFAGRDYRWHWFLLRWWPLGNLWAVYAAQVSIYKRTRGLWPSRFTAAKVVALIFSPAWLSNRLAGWWKKAKAAE